MSGSEEMEVVCDDFVPAQMAVAKAKQGGVIASRQEMPVAEWVEVVKALQASGFFPDLRSAAQAIAKAQAGRELGLPPYYSLQHLFILPGKPPSLDAQAMGMLIKRSGYDYRVVKSDATICTIKFFGLKGEEIGECSFTMAEASKIMQGDKRLVEKVVWKSYPSDLIFARCLSRGYRRFTPHLGVVYLREEIESEETTAEPSDLSAFKVVNATPAQPDNSAPAQPVEPTRLESLNALVSKHGKPRIAEVKKNLKIEGKLLEIPDADFKRFADELEAVAPILEKVKGKMKDPAKVEDMPVKVAENVAETKEGNIVKEMTSAEKVAVLKKLESELGAGALQKMKETKVKLKIEGKLAELPQSEFEKFVEEVRK